MKGKKSISKHLKGKIIKDNRGQWAHPGKITEISSNNITMQGVNYPVLGVSDLGDTQMMYPEQNYQFRGNRVTEYPMMQRGGIVKPLVYTDYNKYLKAKKAYSDSLAVYNKYKDKEEWQGGKNVLQFEDKKEQQQYNDLEKIMDKIQNTEYAEQDVLLKDPNFKRLSNDEQFNRLMAISNKYTNSKEFKEIVARTNYLYTNNTNIQGAKYTPKWFDNKNVTERGFKPISFDSKDESQVNNNYRTTTNAYGTIIDRNTLGSGTTQVVTKYSPNFKEPVQPVTFVKPITKQTAIEEQVKPLYQEPKLTMPVREELIMNRPDAKPKAEGPVFKQGRQFMRESGINKDTRSFNKLPGWYAKGGTVGENFAYDRWRRSLPENLQAESPDYNLRGYWESLSKPELFNPMEFQTEDDGLYHASSRNPETGEQLKGKLHPTFYHALNEDKNAGYATVVKDGKTYTLNEFEEGGLINNNMEYGKGGYTVKRSSDRKGKTHVVIGPDGTKKYFGDPNLGERGKSKYGKDAFYARHKKNLDANPYFRAYARATWEEGGTTPKFNYNNSEINQVTGIPTGKGGLEDASLDALQLVTTPLALANLYKAGKISYDAYQLAKPNTINLSKTYFPTYRKALLQATKALSPFEYGGMIPEQGHISMNKRSLFKYGGLTVTDLNKYQLGGSNLGNAAKIKPVSGASAKIPSYSGGATAPTATGANVGSNANAIGAGIGFGAEMVGALIPEKQYSDDEGADLGSVKSIGESTLEYGAKGAAVTAMLGGADFGIATALGAGYGAYKGWADKEEMEEKQKEANFKNSQRKLSNRMNNSVNFGNANINTSQEMQFAQGGMVLDYNDSNANAELELQETFQMPNGQVGMVDGPSHENGGIAVNLPEGTRIWSDKLRYGGKTFAKHTKPITSKIARLEKEIEEDPTRSKAKQNSIMLLNQQLDHYFDVQETNKEANEMKRTFKNGGMIKRADGSYSKRGLWDNIRANKGSGKKPTPQMLEQERKIKAKMEMGGYMYGQGGTNNPGFRALPEEVQQNILANMAMGGQMYAMGGSLNMYQRGGRRLNLETPNNNMEQSFLRQDTTPQSVNSFEYPVDSDFDMNNIPEELYGNYGQSLPKPLMAATRSMDQRLGIPPTMLPIERATGRYGEFVRPQVTSPGTEVYNPDYKEFNPFNKNEGARFSTPYAMDYETNPNIPKGQPLGSTANAGMGNTTEPFGFFNKAGQFIQNNPGLIGQLGTAALTAGIQSNRVNKLVRPRTLGDVRLSDKVINPNLVDYSAERQAYNRMGLNAMGEAQRGFGSSAAAQAFKNKARLNTLENTGKSYQSQENTNAQIKNATNSARQEAAIKEAMMNNEIDKYNLENVYGYDTMTTAQKNAITAMLGNTAGQTFGKQTDYANQMEQAKILSNSRENTVNFDTIAGSKQDTKEYYMSLPEQQKVQYNAARQRRNLAPYGHGGMMKRSFRTGGTNNPGFNALPESVQENILNNMGMGGYMYSLGGRLMNAPMFAEGGKLPKNVLQSRLKAHMSPEEVDSYLSEYADGGIHIKPSKVGSLRKHLGTPAGKKIPMSKLADKPGDSPAIKKKKVFARNARKWNS